MSSGFNRRPMVACASCGQRKHLSEADKMPPHNPPGKPGEKCYETAYVPVSPRELRSPQKPRTPIRQRNPKRAARQRLEDFGPQGEWMRTLRCATCAARPPGEPSHVRSRAAGGARDGQIPQCPACHRAFHAGRETFAAARGTTVDALLEMAKGYALRWELLPESTRERYAREFRRRYPEAGRLMDQEKGE